jgi:integrase
VRLVEAMRLTDLAVQRFQPPVKGQKSYRDETVRGLVCRVSQGGAKTFILVVGKERKFITIGRYPALSLVEARREAHRLIGEREPGKHRPVPLKMSDALDRFFTEKEAQCRPATLRLYRGIFNRDYKHLHGKPLDQIAAEDITRVTDSLLKRNLPSAANHTLVAAKVFLSWSARRAYITNSPIQYLTPPSKEISRERVLTDEELRSVWQAAETIGYPVGTIAQLLILTGARRTEIGSLQRGWIDFNKQVCTIPANYSKNKRSHTFPIGDRASVLISAALNSVSPYISSERGQSLLFPARRKNVPFNSWSAAKKELDAKVVDNGFTTENRKVDNWTFHDLRRTYATTLHRLGVKLEVVEALLNHISGANSGIVKIYNRHKYETEMREAVNTYEEWFIKNIGG